jgi:UDP-glucose 4-epimerase
MSRSVSEEILALTETGKTKRISKTVAISGASSFTGIWIARAFHERGYSVHALLSSQEGSYTDIKAVRVRFLQQHATLHHNVRAENGSMATWIEKNSPSLWIHHHHFMENFRNKDYDLTQAEAVGIEPLLKIVDALAKASCAGMIYSGTYFEPGEGGQAEDAPATPYAISKKKVWKHLLNETQKASLPISKVVIANPIGPFENEDRMIPNFATNCW